MFGEKAPPEQAFRTPTGDERDVILPYNKSVQHQEDWNSQHTLTITAVTMEKPLQLPTEEPRL